MVNDFGIIYVATGEKFLTECVRSAISAKTVMPDIPISLWTDRDVGIDECHFDSIHTLQNPRHTSFDKINPLLKTKFEKTLFVDTDTYFTESVYEISTLLERFELACAHAPWRVSPKNYVVDELPICFAEANTGVIAYKKCEPVMELFREWGRIYTKQLGKGQPIQDQPAFRKALYLSEVRSIILPAEYNIRTVFPVFKGGGCPAKILHGRDPSLSRAIDVINRQNGIRTFDFRKQGLLKRILRKIKF